MFNLYVDMDRQFKLVVCIILCFILIIYLSLCEHFQQNTIQQIHVLFRHGSRNPDRTYVYPNDPYINDTWEPEGFGQLTTAGKMKVYDIGKYLRKRYDKFLGRVYTPDVIEPICTEFDRTKMSLLLVLAGLYTPVKSLIWNDKLSWLPIPYNIVPSYSDYMRSAIHYCPEYIKKYHDLENTNYAQQFYKNNADLIHYIIQHTGVNNVFDLFKLFKICNTLIVEEERGRKLPTWTEKIHPEFFSKVVDIFYELQVYNDEMKKLSAGYLLKKILQDMRAKQEGTLVPKDRKIFLYSGHEYTVVYILSALEVFKSHMPPYASFVILELHLINDVYGIKILYQDYKQNKPKYLTIPGCDTFCPFDKLLSITESIIPNIDIC